MEDEKILVACYLDDDFFRPRFRLETTELIDGRIQQIDQLIPDYIKKNLDTIDLNDEKTRLHRLRSNLGDILAQLKGSLALDIRDAKFDESLAQVVATRTGG